jgi:ribosomal protein L33
MRSSYHLECKYCDAKKDFESSWLPVDVLEAAANMWITFHAFRKHPDKMTAKRFRYVVNQAFWSVVIIILFTLLTILRVVFFPLWWLLDKLYN